MLLDYIILYTVEAALLAVNNAIDRTLAEELMVALQSEVLGLKDIMPEIAEYYCDCLVKWKSKKQNVSPVVIYILYMSMVLMIISCVLCSYVSGVGMCFVLTF